MPGPFQPGKRYVTLAGVTQHPFSRGRIVSYVSSSINVNYTVSNPIFSTPEAWTPTSSQKLIRITSIGISASPPQLYTTLALIYSSDFELLVQTVKFVRSLGEVEPWKSSNNRELDPGPDCKTDEQIRGL
jgi:hypothetical protein